MSLSSTEGGLCVKGCRRDSSSQQTKGSWSPCAQVAALSSAAGAREAAAQALLCTHQQPAAGGAGAAGNTMGRSPDS